jgi:hypothetical protein
MKRSSLVTAALPRGICTRFPILLKPWFEALIHSQHTTCSVALKGLYSL